MNVPRRLPLSCESGQYSRLRKILDKNSFKQPNNFAQCLARKEIVKPNHTNHGNCQPEISGATPLHKYTFTRICSMKYIKSVESVFGIIAEPNRRAILSLLVSSQQSVGEIERQLRMPQPTVSKHLRVLREAGFVESTVDAQRRLYRLNPEPFQELDAWLAQFRRLWSGYVDALERHLDRMDQSTPTKRKTGEKTTWPKPRA
jgi:DNA-binding transcriptional ArsR family regulator